MRELPSWAIKSQGRDQWRAYYATYIKSAEWHRRRVTWFEEEASLVHPNAVTCLGGCGKEWRLRRDDLHHCSYDRLGHEAHEDLWPLCRNCHDHVHQLLDSSKSWRKLPYRFANQQALAVVQQIRTAPDTRRYESLRDYL